jgi:heme oxygenase
MGAAGPVTTPGGRHLLLATLHHGYAAHLHAIDVGARVVGLSVRAHALLRALERDLGLEAASVAGGQTVSDAEALGACYVFEGSALGACTLVGQIAESGAPVPGYLALLAREGRERWPRVQAALRAYGGDGDAVVAHAQHVFASLISASERA